VGCPPTGDGRKNNAGSIGGNAKQAQKTVITTD
jgi:hypothetical protein